VPVLTPDQFEQLQRILTDAFDKRGIAELVRIKLGDRLDKLVDPDQPTPGIVFDLLTWIDKRDMHTLEVLLQGAMGIKPENGALRAFCEHDVPGALKPIDSQVFVQNLTSGLDVLIAMKDDSAVRQTVGQVRAELQDTNKQIDTLKKYKELHDCLHELEVRLSAIADAVVRAKEPSARRSLGIYARDLRWLGERARAAIPNLPSRQSEEIWVPDLDACAEDIERARVSTIEDAQDALSHVPVKLRRLLTEASRINGFLAQLAGQLKLDSFSKTMDAIANRMRADTRPNDVSLMQLMTGSAAVSVLRSRIIQLVHEHYEWQFLTTQLAAADTSPDYGPDKKITKWPLFKTKLLALCDLAPLEESSQELRTLMERWVAAASATLQSEAQIAAAEDAFAEYSHTCKLHFFEVDKQLKELCSKMTEVAMPLTALLNVIR
jgi:hypothetical protein